MNERQPIQTLALDLEGTLISNAVSQFPRPALREFLDFCRLHVPRIVIYTAVPEPVFRRVADRLLADEEVPPWFPALEHFQLTSQYKDLRAIPGAGIEATRLIDDMPGYVHPEQRACWIPIAPFDAPYPPSDGELRRVMALLKGYAADPGIQ